MAAGKLTEHFRSAVKIREPQSSDRGDGAASSIQAYPLRVDPLFDNPKRAWERIRKGLKLKLKTPIDPYSAVHKDRVRFVCLSDTHGRLEARPDLRVPDGDVLLHAGDFTMRGSPEEVQLFNNFLGRCPHRHKVVIAGNHDLVLDDNYMRIFRNTRMQHNRTLKKMGASNARELLTNCVYLQDSSVTIAGIHIYGSPWTPAYGSWGFAQNRGRKLMNKWNLIPEGVDILITHGPPVGIGDEGYGGLHAGCVDLLNTIQQRVKPAYHLYGHIHEGYGVRTDGSTTFINASTCTKRYLPQNPPVVFDVPLREGYMKNDPPMFSTA